MAARPRIRHYSSRKGFEFAGAEDHRIELEKCTGQRIEWRIDGNPIVFTWQEEGYLSIEKPVRLSSELYDLLYTVSHALMKAVFAGYKKGIKDPCRDTHSAPIQFSFINSL